MFKKVFALTSFTALAGVIAVGSASGCSTTTTVNMIDPDAAAKPPNDADPEAGGNRPKDAGSDGSKPDGSAPDGSTPDGSTPDGSSPDGGPTTCPSTEPIMASALPWAQPAATQPGKCTEKNVTDFQQFLKDNPKSTNDQFEQYVKTQSAACHDCIFTDASKPTWGPIPMSGGKAVTLNIGACFALASGNTQCGQAIQNAFDCDFVACGDCADDAAFSACRTEAQSGACQPYVQAIQSSCKGVPPTVDDVCGTFIQTIRIQCVTANVDGG